MLFIVSGLDRPDVMSGRLEYRTEHRAHYTDLGDDLILAGPYLDAEGEPIGSVIIIRAENYETAESHARADPYWRHGVFLEMSVMRWDWFLNRPEGLES